MSGLTHSHCIGVCIHVCLYRYPLVVAHPGQAQTSAQTDSYPEAKQAVVRAAAATEASLQQLHEQIFRAPPSP